MKKFTHPLPEYAGEDGREDVGSPVTSLAISVVKSPETSFAMSVVRSPETSFAMTVVKSPETYLLLINHSQFSKLFTWIPSG